MKINIAYTRQSFQRADTESSVIWQKQLTTEHALKNNYKIHEYYSDIKSGKDASRTGFQSVLKRIKNDQVASLTVYRIDRLSRDYRLSLSFFQLCAEKEIVLHSIEDGTFNFNKPEERLALQVLSTTAENQREQSVQNRKINNKRKFQDGLPVNYEAPFGYNYSQHAFTIVPEEAETVRFVFESYLSGKGYKKISASTETSPWVYRTPAQVRNIILNSKYYGDFVSKHGTLYDFLPKIITRETYDQAQLIRNDRAKDRTQRRTVEAKLRLKILCPYCGSKLTPFQNHKQRNSSAFYVCPKRLTGQYNDCAFRALNLRTIEYSVQNHVLKFLTREEELMQLYQSVKETLKVQSETQWQKGKKYLKAKQEMIDQLAMSKIHPEAFKQWIEENGHEDHMNIHPQASLSKENLERILRTNPSVPEEMFHLVKEVHLTKNGGVTDIRIKEFNENIINFKQEEIV